MLSSYERWLFASDTGLAHLATIVDSWKQAQSLGHSELLARAEDLADESRLLQRRNVCIATTLREGVLCVFLTLTLAYARHTVRHTTSIECSNRAGPLPGPLPPLYSLPLFRCIDYSSCRPLATRNCQVLV